MFFLFYRETIYESSVTFTQWPYPQSVVRQMANLFPKFEFSSFLLSNSFLTQEKVLETLGFNYSDFKNSLQTVRLAKYELYDIVRYNYIHKLETHACSKKEELYNLPKTLSLPYEKIIQTRAKHVEEIMLKLLRNFRVLVVFQQILLKNNLKNDVFNNSIFKFTHL